MKKNNEKKNNIKNFLSEKRGGSIFENKLKNIACFVFAAMFMLFFAAAASAQLTNTPAVHVILSRTDPSPVQPGDYASIWVKLVSYSRQDLNDFKFTLNPKYPFYLDASETAERYFGKIIAGEQVTLHYRVRVDHNAVEGLNMLDYYYSFGGKDYEGDLNVFVQSLDANLAITEIVVEPELIAPNRESKVIFRIQNLADSVLRDVTFKLDLASENIPLVPVGSSNEIKVYSIKDRETAEIEFKIAALSNAKAQIYKVPLEISYYDWSGKEYTKEVIIGLMVGDAPKIEAIIENSDIVKKNQVGDVDIKIINKGATDIKFLTVFIEETENFKVISPKQVYIGEIDSDDYDNADFRILVKKEKDSKVDIPIVLEYKDANNNEHEQTATLTLNMKINKLANPQKKSGAGTLVFAIIIVVGGYIAYRKWLKKKKKK